MSTFINLQLPPGEALASYDRRAPAEAQAKSVPSTFLEAMTVRERVFVDEQKVPLEIEYDDDDARSFHWVVYASVSATQRSGQRKGSETATVPVGTVRLVPPPHRPAPDGEGPVHPMVSDVHDGREAYVKIGRMATVKAYRGLGLGRLLLETALEWASKHGEAITPLQSPTSREAAKVEAGLSERDRRWHGLVLVHAQTSVEPFYRRLGFERDRAMGQWNEAGLPHVAMWRRIPVESERKRRT